MVPFRGVEGLPILDSSDPTAAQNELCCSSWGPFELRTIPPEQAQAARLDGSAIWSVLRRDPCSATVRRETAPGKGGGHVFDIFVYLVIFSL